MKGELWKNLSTFRLYVHQLITEAPNLKHSQGLPSALPAFTLPTLIPLFSIS